MKISKKAPQSIPRQNKAPATISTDDGETSEGLDWTNTLLLNQEEKIIKSSSVCTIVIGSNQAMQIKGNITRTNERNDILA